MFLFYIVFGLGPPSPPLPLSLHPTTRIFVKVGLVSQGRSELDPERSAIEEISQGQDTIQVRGPGGREGPGMGSAGGAPRWPKALSAVVVVAAGVVVLVHTEYVWAHLMFQTQPRPQLGGNWAPIDSLALSSFARLKFPLSFRSAGNKGAQEDRVGR